VAKSEFQKFMDTPKMKAYVKARGFRDEVGYYPPIEMRVVTEEEYQKNHQEMKLDMQRRRERILAMTK
jgi:hypothetical protein